MTILFLILDILIYNFTEFNTFFFLISLIYFDEKDYLKVIMLGLFIDLILLNTLFINTCILLLIFIFNKKVIKLKTRSLSNYFYINLCNLLLYNVFLILINQNLNINTFIISIVINSIFYLLSYNLCKKHIKLAR